MIQVTRLGAALSMVINADLIETVEATPDTLITLTTGHRLLVQESPEAVVGRVLEYRRGIARRTLRIRPQPAGRGV